MPFQTRRLDEITKGVSRERKDQTPRLHELELGKETEKEEEDQEKGCCPGGKVKVVY